VEATAAFGLPLTDPVPVCWATVGKLPLLSRRTVPMPAAVLADDGVAVAVALSVTDERVGFAKVPWSEAVAGSPSSEETVTELSNDVFVARPVATAAGNDTGGRVVPATTGNGPA
jgi:hypothetical protein